MDKRTAASATGSEAALLFSQWNAVVKARL